MVGSGSSLLYKGAPKPKNDHGRLAYSERLWTTDCRKGRTGHHLVVY